MVFRSHLISRTLFSRAKKGARGKAATKRVMKPYWITVSEKKKFQNAGNNEMFTHF